MANIHPNEMLVTLRAYAEIWGDMKCLVIERWQGGHAIDSLSISNEEEAETFVTDFLHAMTTLGWEE